MRGKTRIGVGLTIIGIAISALFGVATLASNGFPGWILVSVIVLAVGLVMCLWGAWVYLFDRHTLAKRVEAEGRLRRGQLQAEMQELAANIQTHEYWLMVATDYQDQLRVSELDSTLAQLRTAMNAAAHELSGLPE